MSNWFAAVRADKVKVKKMREEMVKVKGNTNNSVRANYVPLPPKKIILTEQWETLASALLNGK